MRKTEYSCLVQLEWPTPETPTRAPWLEFSLPLTWSLSTTLMFSTCHRKEKSTSSIAFISPYLGCYSLGIAKDIFSDIKKRVVILPLVRLPQNEDLVLFHSPPENNPQTITLRGQTSPFNETPAFQTHVKTWYTTQTHRMLWEDDRQKDTCKRLMTTALLWLACLQSNSVQLCSARPLKWHLQCMHYVNTFWNKN